MAPWQRETYPSTAGKAEWEGRDLLFGFVDASGIRADAVYGTT